MFSWMKEDLQDWMNATLGMFIVRDLAHSEEEKGGRVGRFGFSKFSLIFAPQVLNTSFYAKSTWTFMHIPTWKKYQL